MFDGVVHQVARDPFQHGGIAAYEGGRTFDDEMKARSSTAALESTHHAFHHLTQIQLGLILRVEPRLVASQGEQIGRDPGESYDLHSTPLEGFPILRRGTARA
jgi:hypothetical protein